jgi:hypothetical protein
VISAGDYYARLMIHIMNSCIWLITGVSPSVTSPVIEPNLTETETIQVIKP